MKDDKNKIRLIDDYESACNRIINYWLRKQCFFDEETDEVYDWDWIIKGHFFDVGDYSISFDDVLQDIKKEAPIGFYFEYYDHCLKYGLMDIKTPNYNSYLMGLRSSDRTFIQHISWLIKKRLQHFWWSILDIKHWKDRRDMKRKGREFLNQYIDKQKEGF